MRHQKIKHLIEISTNPVQKRQYEKVLRKIRIGEIANMYTISSRVEDMIPKIYRQLHSEDILIHQPDTKHLSYDTTSFSLRRCRGQWSVQTF